MPNTPNLALPYPVLTDTADVPRDIQALATRLDIGISAPLVSSLPGSPVDGQEILYQADATNGILWHLRYRAASASTYKWEFIGGPPLYAETTSIDTTASTASYADATPNAGPSVTLPVAGDYLIGYGCMYFSAGGAGAIGFMSYAIGATAAVDGDSTRANNVATGSAGMTNAYRERRKNALPAAALTAKYKVQVSTGSFFDRSISARPIRLG